VAFEGLGVVEFTLSAVVSGLLPLVFGARTLVTLPGAPRHATALLPVLVREAPQTVLRTPRIGIAAAQLRDPAGLGRLSPGTTVDFRALFFRVLPRAQLLQTLLLGVRQRVSSGLSPLAFGARTRPTPPEAPRHALALLLVLGRGAPHSVVVPALARTAVFGAAVVFVRGGVEPLALLRLELALVSQRSARILVQVLARVITRAVCGAGFHAACPFGGSRSASSGANLLLHDFTRGRLAPSSAGDAAS